MAASILEHTNLTVGNPVQTANLLCTLFGWRIRWQGDAINGGITVHVGSNDSYLALYSPKTPVNPKIDTYRCLGGLNHIGIVVDDLDAVEARVVKAGLTPRMHADYPPGRRFYFNDHDGIEFEVVSY